MKYAGPGRVYDRPGASYGPLWDDRYPIAIVLHTTETLGLPSYNTDSDADMEINPHLTMKPGKDFTVWRHTDLEERSGALRGSRQVYRDTGVNTVMGEKAINIEIIGYSSKATVDKYGGGRRWVGHFGDDDYESIAQVVAWIIDQFDLGYAFTPQPVNGWLYGMKAATRGSAPAWENLQGTTAHGWVFGQSHWDTGVLNLAHVVNLANDINTGNGTVPPPPPDDPEDDIVTKLPTLRRNDGFKAGRPEMKPFVKKMQACLAIEGQVPANTFDADHSPDGLFGSGTEASVRNFQKVKGLTVDGVCGERTWTKLLGV